MKYIEPQVRHFALTNEKRIFVIGYQAGQISIIQNGKQYDFKAHAGNVTALAISPNKKIIASAGGDKMIRIWDFKGCLLYELDAHTMPPSSFSFDKGSQLLASGASDKTICLWSLQDGSLIVQKRGHKSPVTTITFSPDGKKLASGSASGKIFIWGLERK